MFWRTKRRDEDFSEEIRAHIDLEAARLVEDGMDPKAARVEALKRFGNVVASRERFYESGRAVWLDGSIQDLRHAVRVLAKRPAPTVAAILTLALAVGACVSMFSLIDRVLIQPLNVSNPSRLVVVRQLAGLSGVARRGDIVWDMYRQLRDIDWSTLDGIGGSSDHVPGDVRLLSVAFGSDAQVEQARGLFITANYFRILGLSLAAGRDFGPDDDTNSAVPTAILSHRAWRARFGSDLGMVGRTIRVYDVAVRIIGVGPPDFIGTELSAAPPDLFFTLSTAPRLLEKSNSRANGQGGSFTTGYPAVASPISPIRGLVVVGRMKEGATIEQAQAEFAAVANLGDGLARGDRFGLVPLSDLVLPIQSRAEIVQLLTLLAAAVSLLLLIGCTNLTGVLMAGAEERRGEFAMRFALGAGRARIARELVLEAALLGFVGGGTGLVVSQWINRSMAGLVLPGSVPIASLRDGLDGRTVFIAVLAAVVATIVISLGSASTWATVDVIRDLKRKAGSPRLGATKCLVGLQVALSVVLVFGALLFMRSVWETLETDLGFDSGNLVSLTVTGSAQNSGAPTLASVDAVAERVRAIPGVSSATIARTPLRHGSDRTVGQVRIDGATIDLPTRLDVTYIDADYFTTLGQRVVRGRDIDDGDAAALSLVGIVNESMARRLWPEADPLGRQFAIRNRAPITVVGVVRDARLTNLREEGQLAAYLARAQHLPYLEGYLDGSASAFLMVRALSDPVSVIQPLRNSAAEVGLAMVETVTLEEQIGTLLMPQRMGRAWLIVLAAVGMSLSVVGVYGLVSVVGARIEKEIGIRWALGASPGDVVRILTRRTLWPVLMGIAGGSALAYWCGRFADRFMYGIGGSDPMTIVLTVALLGMAAVGAALMPMRRALRVNVVEALRVD